jgi:hypothetical protein
MKDRQIAVYSCGVRLQILSISLTMMPCVVWLLNVAEISSMTSCREVNATRQRKNVTYMANQALSVTLLTMRWEHVSLQTVWIHLAVSGLLLAATPVRWPLLARAQVLVALGRDNKTYLGERLKIRMKMIRVPRDMQCGSIPHSMAASWVEHQYRTPRRQGLLIARTAGSAHRVLEALEVKLKRTEDLAGQCHDRHGQ